MIDLYALPPDFPEIRQHLRNPHDPYPYVAALERAFGKDIDDCRFVPYIQLHEFETLLFTDPEAFESQFESCSYVVDGMKAIIRQFPSIEHIDDGTASAPSKRIIQLLPEFEFRKPLAGPAIAEEIGLPKLRVACPHFDQWINTLQHLGASSSLNENDILN